MEKQSVKKIILFSLFCLVFFGCGVLTLFIIDANLWGWILEHGWKAQDVIVAGDSAGGKPDRKNIFDLSKNTVTP